LKLHAEGQTAATRVDIFRQIQAIRIGRGERADTKITKIVDLFRRLEGMGDNLSTELKIGMALATLPKGDSNYDAFNAYVSANQGDITWDDFTNQWRTHSNRNEHHRSEETDATESAYLTQADLQEAVNKAVAAVNFNHTHGNSSRGPTCWNCNKRGHTRYECKKTCTREACKNGGERHRGKDCPKNKKRD
jgi:hypothetical protein